MIATLRPEVQPTGRSSRNVSTRACRRLDRRGERLWCARLGRRRNGLTISCTSHETQRTALPLSVEEVTQGAMIEAAEPRQRGGALAVPVSYGSRWMRDSIDWGLRPRGCEDRPATIGRGFPTIGGRPRRRAARRRPARLEQARRRGMVFRTGTPPQPRPISSRRHGAGYGPNRRYYAAVRQELHGRSPRPLEKRTGETTRRATANRKSWRSISRGGPGANAPVIRARLPGGARQGGRLEQRGPSPSQAGSRRWPLSRKGRKAETHAARACAAARPGPP